MTSQRRTLITGGAGFIGCNLADRLIAAGTQVVIFDNLSRRGTGENIKWLRDRHGDRFTFIKGDICNYDQLRESLDGIGVIYHLAAQTAVTTSVIDPRSDFEWNALGAFNVLEAARATGEQPIVLYASTNKVYGGMEEVPVTELENRYIYTDLPRGASEHQPLDFHSPYGCSKGAADQYTRDYARIYDLPTVVFRQSCIYGPRQMGVEDQGWVAWFIIAFTLGKSISIYGNGKQVRDLLYIDDLVDAYIMAVEQIDKTRGQVYNIGGGADNAISVWWELRPLLEEAFGRQLPEPRFADWRPGDQPIFIADTSKAEQDFGWRPKVSARDGIQRLVKWVGENRALFEAVGAGA